MYKIAVIGDWDSIYGFGALGLETFRVEAGKSEEAEKTVRRLAEQDYAVIYITEALAADLGHVIEHYKNQIRPAFILIPGISGNTGDGLASVKKSVEKAVGSDIIFGSSGN